MQSTYHFIDAKVCKIPLSFIHSTYKLLICTLFCILLALIHKMPYQRINYKQTCRWNDSIFDIQGFTEDIDTSRFFFHTWDNRILMVKFLWHKEEHHEEYQRGYFFLQCIYQSMPLLQKIQRMNLCKTTGDLLILVDDGLQILGHDGSFQPNVLIGFNNF